MPPVITVGPTYTKTDSTIVAVWTTDIPADSNLSAGGKAAIDNGVAASSTAHQCIVTGLLNSTLYSCVVTSGGTSSSPQNVTTNAAPTRIPITGVSYGVPVKIGNDGDVPFTFVSNDNNEYIMEDDGHGFVTGAPNAGANMQIGRLTNEAALVGVTTNLLTAYGAWATTNGTDGPAGAPMSNKLSGIFGMGGSLYLFQSRTPYDVPQTQYFGNIIRSDDHGATWNSWQAPAVFNANGTPPSPLGSSMFSDSTIGWITPCRYAVDDGTLGYNTAGNQIDGANGLVYIVFTDGHWNNGNALYLMRVPRIQMAAQSTTAFQYWNGPASPAVADFVNDSNWSNASSSKQAIFSATGQCSAPDMVFVPAINSYLMITWYQVGLSTSNVVWTVLAAPTPAGPWTVISTKSNNPSGYYNPGVMHRTVATNVRTNIIPLALAYSGDYANKPVYYFPTTSSLTLFTGGVMAPVLANFVVGGGTGSSSTVTTTTFSSTTGNLLVAAVRSGGNIATTVTSVKNAAGVSFTAIPGSNALDAGPSQGTGLFYLPSTTGNATDAITVTYSPAQTFTALCCWEISGAIASPLDTSTSGVNAASALSVTSSAFTTAQANEIICAMGGIPTVNNTYSLNNSYVVDSDGFPAGAPARYSGAGHLFATSVQTAVTETLTGTVIGSGATISLATFKSAFYNITGNAGTPGATVSYTGVSSGSVTADGSGNYTLPALGPGAYVITPSKGGFIFSPVNSSQTIVATDITGVNFVATASGGGGTGLGTSYIGSPIRYCSRVDTEIGMG